jgi:hypothetical protein
MVIDDLPHTSDSAGLFRLLGDLNDLNPFMDHQSPVRALATYHLARALVLSKGSRVCGNSWCFERKTALEVAADQFFRAQSFFTAHLPSLSPYSDKELWGGIQAQIKVCAWEWAVITTELHLLGMSSGHEPNRRNLSNDEYLLMEQALRHNYPLTSRF